MEISPEYFRWLYSYNRWANRRSLDAAAALSQEQLFQPLGHSWGSVCRVLAHIYNAEWIWFRRWQGESPHAFPDFAELATLDALNATWQALEGELYPFVDSQTPGSLDRDITYTNTSGKTFTMKLWQMMAHVVNHGTHHRGELAAMYTALGVPHDEEDLLFYQLIQTRQRAV